MSHSNSRSPSVKPLSFTVVPFGQYRGQTFDQVPLGYLDWLGSQDWLYGEFKTRLHQYLSRSCIEQELSYMFRDRELDASDFSIQDQLKDKWHGQPMPPAPEPWDWQPDNRRMPLWDLAADLSIAIDHCETVDQLDLLERDERIPKLSTLPKQVMDRIRQQFTAKRQTLSLLALVPDWKRDAAQLALEAITERPELEALARAEAPELMDTVDLLLLS